MRWFDQRLNTSPIIQENVSKFNVLLMRPTIAVISQLEQWKKTSMRCCFSWQLRRYSFFLQTKDENILLYLQHARGGWNVLETETRERGVSIWCNKRLQTWIGKLSFYLLLENVVYLTAVIRSHGRVHYFVFELFLTLVDKTDVDSCLTLYLFTYFRKRSLSSDNWGIKFYQYFQLVVQKDEILIFLSFFFFFVLALYFFCLFFLVCSWFSTLLRSSKLRSCLRKKKDFILILFFI